MSSHPQRLLGITIGALILAAVSAAAGFWFARSDENATRERKPLYWYDPMVPNQHFSKPGKSPFMNMPLVPKYAGESGEASGVRVSPNIVQNLGIRLGRVERVALPAQLRAVGSVAFDERLLEVVQARVDGYVVRLHAQAPFERVHTGQPLADILAPQWLEAEQEYLALLEANAERSSALRDAARGRLTVLGVPGTAIRSLEKTRKASATTTLYAPIDGVITELGVRQGSAFASGASLFRINGLKGVWVNAQVPEGQISAARVGSNVEVHATAWPGIVFKGRVIALLPDVNAETRTLTARVSIDNASHRLSPGMYVTLDISDSPSEPQLVVPSEAVIATGERSVAIVARPDGGFDVRNVTVGREQNGRTPILSGLHEGESIVLSGQFLIDSEASLTATVSRLQSTSALPAPTDTAAGSEPRQ
jgi:membrane fusion protein, copper/silver efflux system